MALRVVLFFFVVLFVLFVGFWGFVDFAFGVYEEEVVEAVAIG